MDDRNDDLFARIDSPSPAPQASGSASSGPAPSRPEPARPQRRAPEPKDASAAYSAADIEVLEGLEPVRRRPGMYIGGTDEKALHHLFAEVIDNSMDEAVAGHATFIEVELGRRRLHHRHRQWPRHPGRPAPEVQGQVGARSHHDDAALRRKVRFQGLRDIRRPARRRRLGRQCAVRPARGRGGARPPALPPALFARQAAGADWKASARSTTAAARAPASIPTPRSSARTRSSSRRRLYRMARSKAYLFGGVEIRWNCAPALLKEKDETPAKAVFHFPGGLKDYLAASLDGEFQVTRDMFVGQEREAGRPRLCRMGRHLVWRRRLRQFLLQHHPDRRGRHARDRPSQRADARA